MNLVKLCLGTFRPECFCLEIHEDMCMSKHLVTHKTMQLGKHAGVPELALALLTPLSTALSVMLSL